MFLYALYYQQILLIRVPEYFNGSTDLLVNSPRIGSTTFKNGDLSFGCQSNGSIGKHIN